MGAAAIASYSFSASFHLPRIPEAARTIAVVGRPARGRAARQLVLYRGARQAAFLGTREAIDEVQRAVDAGRRSSGGRDDVAVVHEPAIRVNDRLRRRLSQEPDHDSGARGLEPVEQPRVREREDAVAHREHDFGLRLALEDELARSGYSAAITMKDRERRLDSHEPAACQISSIGTAQNRSPNGTTWSPR